jgi:ubiquinone/menaquinone biosynthesis C-methylase UbiE
VTAISIAEHLVKEEIEDKFLGEVRRVLKPKGVALIHVPIKSIITRLKRLYRLNIVKDLPRWSVDDDGDVTHRVWFSYQEYKKMFESSGLVVESVFFNYIRSNEKTMFFRLFNKLMKIWSYDFMPVDKMGWKGEFCSKIAVSGGFVCRKLI